MPIVKNIILPIKLFFARFCFLFSSCCSFFLASSMSFGIVVFSSSFSSSLFSSSIINPELSPESTTFVVVLTELPLVIRSISSCVKDVLLFLFDSVTLTKTCTELLFSSIFTLASTL